MGQDQDVIEQLIQLQAMDRKLDRLQKKLDQVPVKLKSRTDAIAELESEREEHAAVSRRLRADADRAELEVKSAEEQREKIKRQMNAPKLTNREYQTLQEVLAGCLSDINSNSDVAIKAMQAAAEADATVEELDGKLTQAKEAYAAEKERLESGLVGVSEELAERRPERDVFAATIPGEPLQIYERVRKKHTEAIAAVDGTIDRAAGKMETDIHCAACYMAITPNDAIHVLGRKTIVQCKSCVRILYVP